MTERKKDRLILTYHDFETRPDLYMVEVDVAYPSLEKSVYKASKRFVFGRSFPSWDDSVRSYPSPDEEAQLVNFRLEDNRQSGEKFSASIIMEPYFVASTDDTPNTHGVVAFVALTNPFRNDEKPSPPDFLEKLDYRVRIQTYTGDKSETVLTRETEDA